MTTVQVQVRIPGELVRIIDGCVEQGKFSSRSEAIKTIVALYEGRQRTRAFYRMLVERSKESKEKPELLLPLDEIH